MVKIKITTFEDLEINFTTPEFFNNLTTKSNRTYTKLDSRQAKTPVESVLALLLHIRPSKFSANPALNSISGILLNFSFTNQLGMTNLKKRLVLLSHLLETSRIVCILCTHS